MNIRMAVASGNRHKLQEIASLLGVDSGQILSPADFPGYREPVEDAPDFEGNAAIKARALRQHILNSSTSDNSGDLWIMADDSGLEVDALHGAPGVHSARYASLESGAPGNAPDEANNRKLLSVLQSVPDDLRSARFVCVIALIPPGATECRHFRGSCEGRIAQAPSGSHGFGYDPLFIPDGYTASMADLGEDIKSSISHRAAAITLVRQFLRKDQNIPL